MESGGFPGLQNQCDLTVSGRVGSIPIHSRQPSSIIHSLGVRLRTRGVGGFFHFTVLLLCGLALNGHMAQAQRPDSSRVQAGKADSTRVRTKSDSTRARRAPTAADTVKAPITPRRAFLYSALVPGLGQAKLGRNRAAATMLAVEAVGLAMIRESGADVREARRMSGSDSVVVISYVNSSGAPDTTTFSRRFNTSYVHVRQSHVEDWVAFLIANHLFSGADAFVAANLWDISTQLSIRVAPGAASVGAKLTW